MGRLRSSEQRISVAFLSFAVHAISPSMLANLVTERSLVEQEALITIRIRLSVGRIYLRYLVLRRLNGGRAEALIERNAVRDPAVVLVHELVEVGSSGSSGTLQRSAYWKSPDSRLCWIGRTGNR